MRIAFRVDASIQIGSGHVMRCLTLADALRREGAECFFVSKVHDGHMNQVIQAKGYRVQQLGLSSADDQICATSTKAQLYKHWLGGTWQADATHTQLAIGREQVLDWLIVDHYAIDMFWEQALRPFCLKLMVIDDLANRIHDCDLLLDQNLGRTGTDYESLVPIGSKLLIGPEFALLRPEFSQLRAKSLSRRVRPEVKHVLISMGGVDTGNLTGQVLGELAKAELPKEIKISVVMGANAPWLELVRNQASDLPCFVEVLVNVQDMAQLMMRTDLAIGAAGGTAWERCCMGLPSLIFVLADNQESGAQALQGANAVHLIRSVNQVAPILNNLLKEESRLELKKMSRFAAQITDGRGATKLCNHLVGHKNA